MKRLILAAILFTAVSCEGFRTASGTVIDKESRQPLAGVQCVVLSGVAQMLTDSTGKYRVQNKMGGCMPCKDIVVQFSKPGYKSRTEKNPSDSVIVLER